MFTGIFSSLFHVSKILVTVLWIRIRIHYSRDSWIRIRIRIHTSKYRIKWRQTMYDLKDIN